MLQPAATKVSQMKVTHDNARRDVQRRSVSADVVMQVVMRVWQWDWWQRLATYRMVDVAVITVALSVIVLWLVSVPPRWSLHHDAPNTLIGLGIFFCREMLHQPALTSLHTES
jgi:hypothetical protein